MSLTPANAGLQVSMVQETLDLHLTTFLQSARLAAVKQAESARRAAEDVLESDGDKEGGEVRKMKAARDDLSPNIRVSAPTCAFSRRDREF